MNFPKAKKGELMRKALEMFSEVALDTLSAFAAIATSGYGASYTKLDRNTESIRKALDKLISADPDGFEKRKRSFRVFISTMKKDGLIEEKNGKFKATILGLKKLKRLKQMPANKYKIAESTEQTMKIFMFDIKESERKKRNWLRQKLIELKFKPIQKSVFAGKMALPKEFMDDIRRLKILDQIDILEITKKGSLREVI